MIDRDAELEWLNDVASDDVDPWEAPTELYEGYVYPSYEVAWLGFYEIVSYRPVPTAVCLHDGELFSHPQLDTCRAMVETHIIRGHRTVKRERQPLPKECPF